jgi:hypothetical protein
MQLGYLTASILRAGSCAWEEGVVYSETGLPHGAVLWRFTGSGGSVIPVDGCVLA